MEVGLPRFLLVSIFSGAEITPESLIGSSMVNPEINSNMFDNGKKTNIKIFIKKGKWLHNGSLAQWLACLPSVIKDRGSNLGAGKKFVRVICDLSWPFDEE